MPGSLGDLFVLVSDSNMKAAVQALLSRTEAMAIRAVQAEIRAHPQRDSGCCFGGVEFLSAFAGRFQHALLMFDREGCGKEDLVPADIETMIEERLSHTGWNDRVRVIVLDPELEAWVWSSSPHVEECLGWRNQPAPLRRWLLERGHDFGGDGKPLRPKEAMESVLYATRTPRSSAIYRRLAETVSWRGCVDRAFLKLQSVLQDWFGLR